MEQSSLIKIFDGVTLVGLEDGYTNATQTPLTIYEKECLRVFAENEKLKKKIKELEKELEVSNEYDKAVRGRSLRACVNAKCLDCTNWQMNKTVEQLRGAFGSPNGPFYGSDIVPLIADLCEGYEQLQAENERLQINLSKWQELSKWQDNLLGCYRIGTRPSDKCLDRIHYLKQALKGGE